MLTIGWELGQALDLVRKLGAQNRVASGLTIVLDDSTFERWLAEAQGWENAQSTRNVVKRKIRHNKIWPYTGRLRCDSDAIRNHNAINSGAAPKRIIMKRGDMR